MASHLLEKVAQDGTNSLRERVYRHLEAALREGQLHHGTCLDQDRLCEELGVSRTRCATRSSGWKPRLRDHPARKAYTSRPFRMLVKALVRY